MAAEKMKPILFNTEMVKAILEGRKTVTRRVVKYDPKILESPFHKANPEVSDIQIIRKLCKPPFEINDVLYVRETWSEWTGGYIYKAWSGPFPQPGASTIMNWHPSIHMPKEAARIFLRVTDVRVERLQDMLTIDFCNEGLELYKTDGRTEKSEIGLEYEFANLWDSTIKKDQLEFYGWDANPYVWVIEFENISEEIKSKL